MANFIVIYSGNGVPSASRMSDHLDRFTDHRGHILPNVWWVNYNGSADTLRERVQRIMGNSDNLIVIEAKSAAWTKLLVDGDEFADAWAEAISIQRPAIQRPAVNGNVPSYDRSEAFPPPVVAFPSSSGFAFRTKWAARSLKKA